MLGAQQGVAHGMGCTTSARLQVIPEGGLYNLRDAAKHLRHQRRERTVRCTAALDPAPDSAAVSRYKSPFDGTLRSSGVHISSYSKQIQRSYRVGGNLIQ